MIDRRKRVKVSGFKHDKKAVDNNDFAMAQDAAYISGMMGGTD